MSLFCHETTSAKQMKPTLALAAKIHIHHALGYYIMYIIIKLKAKRLRGCKTI